VKLRIGSDGVLAVQLPSDLDAKQARAFFRKNVRDIVERMRKPTDPANNVAALMVAEFAVDPRLRAEARRAIEAARTAREARIALDRALDGYASPTSHPESGSSDDIA
jgi:hypothetical protein